MKLLIVITILIILFGCVSVPLTLEEQYERENARIIAIDSFWTSYDTCLRNFGVIRMTLDGRIYKPTINRRRPDFSIWEMRSMRCVNQ